MPYISELERDRRHKKQQEQKERARWMHFTNAVKDVQEKEAGTTDESAAEQLVTAIVDRRLAARWDDEAGLQTIIPNEFSGILKICLDGVGFIKRSYAPAKVRSSARNYPIIRFVEGQVTDDDLDEDASVTDAKVTRTYPKLEFVNGPVVDADLDRDAPLTEVNTLHYIPLLVLKEDMDRWPLEDSSTKVGNIANKSSVRRSGSASEEKIWQAARKVYAENPSDPPNTRIAEKRIRQLLPGARRKLIRPILSEPEFAKLRRSAGKQPKV